MVALNQGNTVYRAAEGGAEKHTKESKAERDTTSDIAKALQESKDKKKKKYCRQSKTTTRTFSIVQPECEIQSLT
eukprot:1866736-Rhodomonas_salina.1